MKSLHMTNIKYQDFEKGFYYITYPGVKPFLYAINLKGVVLSLVKNREKIIKYDYDKGYYRRVNLRSITKNEDDKTLKYMVSRLVLWEFVSQPSNYKNLEANHCDGNHLNNYYKNLEWVTTKENAIHKAKLGLAASSERHGWNNHKEYVIKDIIPLIKNGVSAPEIALFILKKYPDLYSSKSKYDYDRIRGLVSKIKNKKSWYNFYNSQSSTTIENIPSISIEREEVSRVGVHPIKICSEMVGTRFPSDDIVYFL